MELFTNYSQRGGNHHGDTEHTEKTILFTAETPSARSFIFHRGDAECAKFFIYYHRDTEITEYILLTVVSPKLASGP